LDLELFFLLAFFFGCSAAVEGSSVAEVTVVEVVVEVLVESADTNPF
jgi:hypothetical protein